MARIIMLRGRAEVHGLRRVLAQITEREEAMTGNNTLGRLNEALFEELEALRAVDPTDADALAAEVERSKAIEGIAKTVIDNASTVLMATKMRAQYTNTVSMPKMLEG